MAFDQFVDKKAAFGTYYPYKRDGVRNPDFDDYSSTILGLKKCDADAIDYFSGRLKTFLTHHRQDENVICLVVPRSDESKGNSGCHYVAFRVAKQLSWVQFHSTGIRRKTPIKSLHEGGDRTIATQINSLTFQPWPNQSSDKKNIILIIDDVTTTGNSLTACSTLVKFHNPDSEIIQLAFGQTFNYRKGETGVIKKPKENSSSSRIQSSSASSEFISMSDDEWSDYLALSSSQQYKEALFLDDENPYDEFTSPYTNEDLEEYLGMRGSLKKETKHRDWGVNHDFKVYNNPVSEHLKKQILKDIEARADSTHLSGSKNRSSQSSDTNSDGCLKNIFYFLLQFWWVWLVFLYALCN